MEDNKKHCHCEEEGHTCDCGHDHDHEHCDCGCDEEAEIITMVDPEGGEHFFAKIMEFDVHGITYAVLQEIMGNEEETEDEQEFYIAAKTGEGENAEYGFISDEKVFNEVVEELNKMLEEEGGCCDCGCDDCED